MLIFQQLLLTIAAIIGKKTSLDVTIVYDWRLGPFTEIVVHGPRYSVVPKHKKSIRVTVNVPSLEDIKYISFRSAEIETTIPFDKENMHNYSGGSNFIFVDKEHLKEGEVKYLRK